MLSFNAERLRRLPIRRTKEVWEVAAMPLPTRVADENDKKKSSLMAACVCMSSEGGAMMADMQTVDAFDIAAPLTAIARFATDPHRDGAAPLGYLPARMVLGPMPDDAREHAASVLSEIGIAVEFKAAFGLTRDFFAGLIEHLVHAAPTGSGGPVTTAGLLRRKGMTVERVRAFAHAARAFWRAKPWTFDEDTVLWSIEPTPKTKELRYFTIMGHGGEEFGLAFHAGPKQFMRMMNSEEPAAYFGELNATQWYLGFEYAQDAPPMDAALWEHERLALAGDDAFPVPVGITPSGRVSRPTPETLTLMEGVMRVFAVATKKEVQGGAIHRSVPTLTGEVGFVLQAVMRE